jgi:hypothetical protein
MDTLAYVWIHQLRDNEHVIFSLGPGPTVPLFPKRLRFAAGDSTELATRDLMPVVLSKHELRWSFPRQFTVSQDPLS